MARREFPKAVKRAALERSKGFCEAVGKLYGLKANARCWWPLENGVEFDHVKADSNLGEPTLENCAAVCERCHQQKTKADTTRAAKTVRQRDKNTGVSKPKKTIRSRNTFKPYVSNTKQINRSG